MTREQAQDKFSDYLEDALDPAAASELLALERTMTLLHRLPAREPTLDLWREFAPQAAAYKAERRLPLPARLRLHWELAAAALGEGILIWTHALADRAGRRWGRQTGQETRRAEE